MDHLLVDHLPVDHLPVDRLPVIHQTMTQKTNMMVFALMTPIKIKNMFQIMRLKEIAVMKSKMTLQIGFMQD